jgi:hypothetical protein
MGWDSPSAQHHQVGPPFTHVGKKVESPSRQRHHGRCAAAQLEKAKEEATKATEQDSVANEERVFIERQMF